MSHTVRYNLVSACISIGILVMPQSMSAGPIAYVYSALGQFGTVNLANGSFQPLPAPGVLVADLSAGPGQSLYVIDSDINVNLLTLDPLTGKTMLIGSTNQALEGIEVDQNGLLFGQSGSSFYSLNSSTGAASLVGNFGSGLNFDFAQGAFSAGSLYLVGHISGGSGTSLYQVNPMNGNATLIGANNYFVETIAQSTGTLYGFTGMIGSSSAGPIATIDPKTGIATKLVNQDPALAAVIAASAQIEAVPEPGTCALVGIGFIAFTAWRRFHGQQHRISMLG